jgi:hypothetical protein
VSDLKLYQIPRSVLRKEPKPIAEIDFLEELQEQGFDKPFLETPQTLTLIGKIAELISLRLGHAARTNYGVLSIFDKDEMADYQQLVENYRMNPVDTPSSPDEGKTKRKKKKKK